MTSTATGQTYQQEFTKPDGRPLTLYGLKPIVVTSEIPSPSAEAVDARPVMRWHPLRGEWVMYATHRMGRTFLPPPEYNPLSPTSDPAHPTELPRGVYDIAVFENRFPSLTLTAPEPDSGPAQTRAGVGRCEVVVFSQDASGRLCDLSDEQMSLLLSVWADRTTRLAATGKIKSVEPSPRGAVPTDVAMCSSAVWIASSIIFWRSSVSISTPDLSIITVTDF